MQPSGWKPRPYKQILLLLQLSFCMRYIYILVRFGCLLHIPAYHKVDILSMTLFGI
jgi:hypothetical protein